jgi:hypothetical protein
MAELKGLSNVLRNLNKEIENIQLHTREGLTEAALVVKYDSVKGTPIDLGNLRNSAFILVTGDEPDNKMPSFGGSDAGKMASDHSLAIGEGKAIVNQNKWRLKGIVGYTAFYALFVHEMPAHYNFNQGSNKFLQKALLKNKERILRILIKWAKIKK